MFLDNISIFAIHQKNVEMDEDFCLKMKSLQSISDQPYSKQRTVLQSQWQTAALPELLRTLQGL